jgi:hypothetical protein
LRAAQQTGGVARVEIAPDGAIRIVLGDQAPSSDTNSWDEIYAADKDRSA